MLDVDMCHCQPQSEDPEEEHVEESLKLMAATWLLG
jgi:hypothetical protein